MRTPPRLMVALVTVAGFALAGATSASAQSINLSGCASLTVSGTTLICVPVNNGGNNNTGTAPSCSVTATPRSGPPGTLVNVNASCSGTTPITYTWSGGGFMQNGALTGSGNLSANTTFMLTATNSAGSTTASDTFTVTSTNNPTPPNGGNSGGGEVCSGFGSTAVLNATWPAPGVTSRFLSTQVTAFTSNVALLVKFTTGSKTGFGRITAAEWGSAPTIKTGVISANPCDFGPQQSPYAIAQGVTATVNFSVGPNAWGYPALDPNTTYYFNIENKTNGVDTCNGQCDVFIDLKSP